LQVSTEVIQLHKNKQTKKTTERQTTIHLKSPKAPYHHKFFYNNIIFLLLIRIFPIDSCIPMFTKRSD